MRPRRVEKSCAIEMQGETPELAAKFGGRSIPTLAMFKGGEVADIKVGAAPKTALSAWISRAA